MNETAARSETRRRPLLPVLAAVAGACVVGLLVYGVSTQSANRTLDEQVAQRRRPPAPDPGRALPLLSGHGTSSIATFAGQVRVLNFWASWCEPCRAEAPLLQRAQERLAPLRGTVLGVAYEDVSSDARDFVRKHHLTFPELRDGDGSFARAYGTNQLPESFVIDRAGRIVAIARGQLDKRFLDRAVALAQNS